MTIAEITEIVASACKEFQVKRLDIFGSFARGAEKLDSDIDLLVEFENPESRPSKRYFGLLHYLEDAFGCEVDLLTMNSLKNPVFRRQVLTERVNIYGGRDMKTPLRYSRICIVDFCICAREVP